MTIEQRNNAIAAYMGGPDYLKEKHFDHLMDVEFELIGPEDLQFHSSWDWMIPVWKKIRFEMTPVMVIHAISCIDDDAIDPLHELVSQVAIDWCKKHDINL
jgi:hypothetical protein